MGKGEKPKRSWRERKKTIKHKWLAPLIFAEWLCEWVSYLLGRWAFLDILGHAGRLAILFAVVSYIMGADERRMQAENQRKAKHYQAWQVINAAQGKTGSGGRTDALQDLHSDGILLTGVDISQAHLSKLDLAEAELDYANLGGAHLTDANLAGAILVEANFAGATLYDSNLSGAHITDANLAGATFYSVKLTGADIQDTNLAEANFYGANLAEANLSNANLAEADLSSTNLAETKLRRANLASANLAEANLSNADLARANLFRAALWGANLAGANLERANLAGANLKGAILTSIEKWQEIKSIAGANIYGVKNPPDGFIEWARGHAAVSIEDPREWDKLLREKMQKTSKNGEQLDEEKR